MVTAVAARDEGRLQDYHSIFVSTNMTNYLVAPIIFVLAISKDLYAQTCGYPAQLRFMHIVQKLYQSGQESLNVNL